MADERIAKIHATVPGAPGGAAEAVVKLEATIAGATGSWKLATAKLFATVVVEDRTPYVNIAVCG